MAAATRARGVGKSYKKNEIKDPMERKIVQQAPEIYHVRVQKTAPSKDYCQLLVTEKGIAFCTIPVTLKPASIPATPTQIIMTYEAFMADSRFSDDLKLIFGAHCVHRALLIASRQDVFRSLDKRLSIHVISYMDIVSILRLGQTSRHFYKVCNSKRLWKRLHRIHHIYPYNFSVSYAKKLSLMMMKIGWKKWFFMTMREKLAEERVFLSFQASNENCWQDLMYVDDCEDAEQAGHQPSASHN